MANSGRAAERRPDGMPVGTPFKKGKSGNPDGRPKGAVNLSQRIRHILETDAKLPKAIAETILSAVGEDMAPVDALIIAGLLQALQGDKGWADWLTHNGYGKPKERVEHKRNVISSAPFIQVMPYEHELPKGRQLSVEEIGRLYAESADHLRLFMILMLGTGARNEAICTLEWPQVDFENGLIHLNPEGRKQTSKRRPIVRLVPFVREQLEPLKQDEGRVLAWRGKAFKTAHQGIEKAVIRAKLDEKGGGVTPYSFRHTVARWLRKEGVSPWRRPCSSDTR